MKEGIRPSLTYPSVSLSSWLSLLLKFLNFLTFSSTFSLKAWFYIFVTFAESSSNSCMSNFSISLMRLAPLSLFTYSTFTFALIWRKYFVSRMGLKKMCSYKSRLISFTLKFTFFISSSINVLSRWLWKFSVKWFKIAIGELSMCSNWSSQIYLRILLDFVGVG